MLMAKRDALLAGMMLAVAPNKTPLATVSWPCMQKKKKNLQQLMMHLAM